MMAEYHVGLGNEWKNKSEVTREAIDAVAGFLLLKKKECRFEYDGKKYVMRIEEY